MEIQSLIVKAYDIMISDWSWFRKRGIERYWNHIKLSFFRSIRKRGIETIKLSLIQINQKKRDWSHKTLILIDMPSMIWWIMIDMAIKHSVGFRWF
jgi:hypothetical protein